MDKTGNMKSQNNDSSLIDSENPWQYCSGTLYDPVTEWCCDGRVNGKRSFYRCCGTGTYDILSQTCQNGIATTKTNMCNGKTHNPRVRFCHNKKLYQHYYYVLCNGNVYRKI
ncbi:galaxin-like [Clytia hemisphaerica]|uniref:Galaxin-like repeats domain-containing protein n=1 Tax=Clytia hemisphaerica TaxID=252671 RepID=A0A7M5WZE3_9CNID